MKGQCRQSESYLALSLGFAQPSQMNGANESTPSSVGVRRVLTSIEESQYQERCICNLCLIHHQEQFSNYSPRLRLCICKEHCIYYLRLVAHCEHFQELMFCSFCCSSVVKELYTSANSGFEP
jgi:hypothetical protein